MTDINIPEGVTNIEDETFADCFALTSISLPDSVTSIGSGAFNCCSMLTNLSIPDCVTYIGRAAFSDCSNLTLIVGHHTYAAQYAEENNIPYAFPASDS